MKWKLCFLMLALHILVWVSGATRSFPQTDAISHPAGPGPEEAPRSSPNTTELPNQPNKEGMAETKLEEEEYGRRGAVGKVGSSPPRCEHKCYGCTPCEAIQVPSISRRRRSHLTIQYANYEPESWKCKCGPSFYSP